MYQAAVVVKDLTAACRLLVVLAEAVLDITSTLEPIQARLVTLVDTRPQKETMVVMVLRRKLLPQQQVVVVVVQPLVATPLEAQSEQVEQVLAIQLLAHRLLMRQVAMVEHRMSMPMEQMELQTEEMAE
jgi:hypothetical protein